MTELRGRDQEMGSGKNRIEEVADIKILPAVIDWWMLKPSSEGNRDRQDRARQEQEKNMDQGSEQLISQSMRAKLAHLLQAASIVRREII